MRHRIPSSAPLTQAEGVPTQCYQAWREALDTATPGLLLVDFELSQYWLEAAPAVALTALYCIDHGRLRVAVTDQCLSADATSPLEQFECWLVRHQLVAATWGETLPLLPRIIDKPWGREIWYTGVEQRGVCLFGAAEGPAGPDKLAPAAGVPIPWLQAVMPGSAIGEPGRALVLLKILDPAPQAVTGDLYFELHESKREVYLVSHVDQTAWPDGVGYMRYGFAPEKLRAAASAQQFRDDYLAAVEAYREVRNTLDSLPEGVAPSSAQQAQEPKLRHAMDSFTAMRPLREGDVVVVPPWLPHALQHGVRTVEFQTPVYERRILSFAQKVLTQAHWDTPEVVDRMLLSPPAAEPFPVLVEATGVRVERIVDFPDFEVHRVFLEDERCYYPGPVRDYLVLMVVQGELALDGRCYESQQALLLPRGSEVSLMSAKPAQALVLLLAMPCP
jgi:hypothetical protein